MTTTHLFVELLVIGFGAAIWVALLVAALLGQPISFDSKILAWDTLVSLLPLIYVFGILIDRFADWCTGYLDERHFRAAYAQPVEMTDVHANQQDVGADHQAPESGMESATRTAPSPSNSHDQYHKDRRTMVEYGQELWKDIVYGRSRLRICRGWAINSLACAIAFLFYSGQDKLLSTIDFSTRIWITISYTILAVFCFLAWNSINQKEYKKIRRQAEWIRNEKGTLNHE